jgi:hypothetical protein
MKNKEITIAPYHKSEIGLRAFLSSAEDDGI